MFYQPRTASMSYSSLYPQCPEMLLAHSTYLANTGWPKWKIKMYSRTNLQMHFLMSGIIRSTGSLHVFSTSVIMFLYPVICGKQAWRDSQPKVFKNRRKISPVKEDGETLYRVKYCTFWSAVCGMIHFRLWLIVLALERRKGMMLWT